MGWTSSSPKKQVGFQLDQPGSAKAAFIAADGLEKGRGRETTPSKSKLGRYGRRGAVARPTAVAAAVLGAILLCVYVLAASHNAFSMQALSISGGAGLQSAHRFGDGKASTLVIYVYAHTDPEYEGNLRYFLEFGVRPGDGCDYLVVVQEGPGVLATQLPPLPENVHAVTHPNECFDWGTFGWAIEERLADTARYRHIIFLNSSVRGPFLPAYWPADKHWSSVLTERITREVKLVGATISCEGANQGGVLSGALRRNPHVQSYVMATDQTGLALLQQDGRVLKCYRDIHDAIWHAEMGSSAAILEAGYNIDSLMLRYQGVDWRDRANWGCNAGINPYAEHMYDGINLSPFEVMFVKVKEFLLEANWTTATSAKKYSAWAWGQGGGLASNEYTTKKKELRAMKILHMRARGSACFDFPFYKAHNPDLPAWGRDTIWEHFVMSGQHEGRVFRFRCKPGQKEYQHSPPPPAPAAQAPPPPQALPDAAAGQAVTAADLTAATAAATAAMQAATQAAQAATAAAAAAAAMQQQVAAATGASAVQPQQQQQPADAAAAAAAVEQPGGAAAVQEQQEQPQPAADAAEAAAQQAELQRQIEEQRKIIASMRKQLKPGLRQDLASATAQAMVAQTHAGAAGALAAAREQQARQQAQAAQGEGAAAAQEQPQALPEQQAAGAVAAQQEQQPGVVEPAEPRQQQPTAAAAVLEQPQALAAGAQQQEPQQEQPQQALQASEEALAAQQQPPHLLQADPQQPSGLAATEQQQLQAEQAEGAGAAGAGQQEGGQQSLAVQELQRELELAAAVHESAMQAQAAAAAAADDDLER